jgi:hypothetical protein
MKIKCSNCGHELHLAELLGYAEAYLLKAIAPIAVLFLIQIIRRHLLTPERGIIEDQMIAAARVFEISCSECKKVDCWTTVDEQPKPHQNQI